MSQGARPALQSRSRATRDKLLKALECLLRERSFAEVTVADIAREAGLAVGTVYRRFENKDAFIPVLFEIYKQRLDAFMGPAGGVVVDPEGGLKGVLRQLTEQSWKFLTSERGIARETHLYARLRPDLVGEEWDALLAASQDSYGSLIDAFAGEIKRPRQEAAEMLSYHFNTALTERALYPKDGVGSQMTVSDMDFVRAIADFAYGYLVTEAD